MASQRLGRLPEGVRDLLPAETRRKRQLERGFAKLAESWGYHEVTTPTFEYFENLCSGEKDDDKLYKFLDRKGHIMALRPDLTRPIARLVATRMRGAPLPIRLYYLAHAFSYEEPLVRRQREFYQAGVEILGAGGPAADAEAVALAVESLHNTGLKDFRLSLGHVGIFNGLMAELELPEEQVKAIKKAVENKDFVHLGEQLAARDIAPECQRRITSLLSLRGGEEVLARASDILDSKEALQALDNLKQVYTALAGYGVQQYVTLDLGLLLGLDYYTGVIFEGYTLSLGFPVCGGGRYDRLLGHFGYDLPATGFAMNVDQLLSALEKQQGPAGEPPVDVLVAWAEERLLDAVRKVKELRDGGLTVQLELAEREKPDILRYAEEKGISRVIYIDQNGCIQELK
ncbi:MAG: ATP phosphoribosyltransferase regulatory subunit [Desulfotomaculum sp.]|nr:ATP phosphoribosyltransferase regulatory subunit [Desulfotomaculum sp.]